MCRGGIPGKILISKQLRSRCRRLWLRRIDDVDLTPVFQVSPRRRRRRCRLWPTWSYNRHAENSVSWLRLRRQTNSIVARKDNKLLRTKDAAAAGGGKQIE